MGPPGLDVNEATTCLNGSSFPVAWGEKIGVEEGVLEATKLDAYISKG